MHQQPAVRVVAPPAPSRMSLSAVVKGKQDKPKRIVLYGVEGIGKSTFGANAPKPIFIGAEDGTAHLDVERLTIETWRDLLDVVRLLTNDPHEYQTFVLDTLDWVEPMLWDFICKRDSMANVEAYGYGKGYITALDEWRVLLAALERMQAARKMHVILLAHSWIKPFKNPEGDDFDRYEMKLHAKAAGLIKEWAETVLFTNYETFASKDAKTKRVKGVSTGARLMYTTRCAAFDAKNRNNLADFLPLSWAEFVEGCTQNSPTDPATLRAEIERKAKVVGGAVEKNTMDALAKAGDDVEKLTQLNNWINAKTGAAGQGA